MSVLDVKTLLKLVENERIELKQCGEKIPLSFYESYSAMANGSGGEIYLGIIENKPENIISGVDNAPQKKKQLCNSLSTKSKIANNLFSSTDIEIINTEFGDVMRITVHSTPINQRPVFLNGDISNSYKRVDEGDKLLTDEEIQSMVNDADTTKFDQRPNEFGFGVEDMDENAISEFIKMVKKTGKISSIDTMKISDILSRIGALVFDKEKEKLILTNGAILFFGKSYAVNSICPSLWFDYQEKNGVNERFSNRITNKDLDYESNVFNFYKRVFERLFELLPSPFYLKDGINIGKALMEEIVREAIANAISNVELRSQTGLIIIKTKTSLSIRNAGGILTGIDQALKGGISIPRNPGIFNFFLAMGISDHGGFGIPNIFDKMHMLKMPTPELKESYNRDMTSLSLSFIELNNNLSKEEERVILFLGEHPEGVSSSIVANLLSCSNETARQILARLVTMGEIKDNGKTNKGKLYFSK